MSIDNENKDSVDETSMFADDSMELPVDSVSTSDVEAATDANEKDSQLADAYMRQDEIEDTDACTFSLFNDPVVKLDKVYAFGESLCLPSAGHAIHEFLTTNAPNTAIPSNDKTVAWYQKLESAYGNYMSHNAFSTALRRPDAVWVQDIREIDPTLRPSKPKVSGGNGSSVSGNSAVMLYRQVRGEGTYLTIPCYGSGIWLTIKIPSNDELHELESRIYNSKKELGRRSGGRVHSNAGVYLVDEIMNFIFETAYTSNLTDSSAEKLRKHIKITDYRAILAYFMSGIHTKGYPFSQPCIADMSNCNAVYEGIVDFAKMIFVDRTFITPRMIAILGKRSGRVTDQDLEDYQAEIAAKVPHRIVVSETLAVNFKIPTIEENSASGTVWLENIIQGLSDDLSLSVEQRKQTLLERVKLQVLGEYIAWIDSFEIINPVDGNVVTVSDEEGITGMCVDISGDEVVGAAMFEAIAEIIENTAISVVGIPNYRCQSCNKTHDDVAPSGIIPIDIEKAFFSTTRQHLTKIAMKAG